MPKKALRLADKAPESSECCPGCDLIDRDIGRPFVSQRGAGSGTRRADWECGSRPAIPAKRNEAPVACPELVYTNRNHVERLWARLKEWRSIATRYEKTASSFMGVLCLAAALDWLKP
jgi:transposase